jgi:hypothetical protein
MGARTPDVGKRDKISGHGGEVTRLEAAGICTGSRWITSAQKYFVSSSRPAIRERYEPGKDGLCF